MPDLTITTTTIQKRIERHPVQRYNTLMNYYRGEHPTILNRPALPAPKPDNRMISNFPGYIVDVNLGYFMGVPVRYSSKTDDTKFSEVLKDIFEYNVESDENVELAKSMGISHTFRTLVY